MRNARWSNPSEIKRALSLDGTASGGPILYFDKGRRWTYTGEGHTIFLGVSGAGKSRRGMIPMIRSFIDASESFVAVDPKGEIYQQTACYLNDEYEVHVLDFRHVLESEQFNPLALCYELYKTGDSVKKQIATELLDDLAYSLYPTSNRSDPFWIDSARSVFVACALTLFEHATPEQVTLANIYHIIAKGEERDKNSPGNIYLKQFVKLCPEESVAAMLLQSYVNTASDTRAGIRSTFLEGISLFARSDGLISMMAADDLHINGLDGVTPTGIYILLPDESPIYDGVASVICGQLMGHYIRLAQDKYDGKLPRRLNVCIDELASVGKSIRSLAHLMSASRSRNIRLQLVLQSLSQLDTLYGTSEATTIRSNADVYVAFRTNHWETLTELSHKCGEREVEHNGQYSREPLIYAAQLAAMKTGQALVMISGATQFISWLPDYTEMFDCSEWRKPERAMRHEQSAAPVFDIRKLVDAHNEEKALRATIEKDMAAVAATQEASTLRSAVESNNLLYRIDAQIAKIEQEEPNLEKKIMAQRGYGITLIRNGGAACRAFLYRFLIKETNMTPIEIIKALNSLPHTFRFNHLAAAITAYHKLIEKGAIVESSF